MKSTGESSSFSGRGAQSGGTSSDNKNKVEISIFTDKNGMVTLRNNRGSTVTVTMHGAQVLSWKNELGQELLFISNRASYQPPRPVRGGIQICFPEFGNRQGGMEQHGFARKKFWIIDDKPPPLSGDFNGKVNLDLLLIPSEDDFKIWPHKFEFRLRFSLGEDGKLTLISRIRNIDAKDFSFSIVFHTYFSISDISEVRIEGMETLDYLDNLLKKERFTQQAQALTFESEVDRVYVMTRETIAVKDHQRRRTFAIRKTGLPDIVVWNPWDKKAKSITDLGDEEYKQMLCVDGASIETPIILKPGREWTGRLELSHLPFS